MRWTTGGSSAPGWSACRRSSAAIRCSRSGWTTASSASSSTARCRTAARFFGWEVADAADLDALAARLEKAGVDVTAEPRTLADARRVRGLISFADPDGNRLEAFYGAEIDETPFRPGRSISGFRTGPLGLGHAVLTVENIDPMMAFYVDLLGFGLSDYIAKPFRAYFFHVNARHHSLAHDRDRQERHASSDGGIVLARRCRAGL